MSDSPPTLVLATEAEKRSRDLLQHSVWGNKLNVDEFLQREQVLRSTAWARTNMFTWLLVEGPQRRVLSSLETFRVRSRHGIRPGSSFEIASVYTEPALRGNGYATRLLEGLAERLGENPRAQALTLYSDIGTAHYERAGFSPVPSFDWILPACRGAARSVSRSDERGIVELLLAARRPGGRFALLPDGAQVEWHRARERIYARLLGQPTVAHGALRCGDDHALIAGDVKNGHLVVLQLVADRADGARRLLEACADEAARAGLPDVLIWCAPYGGDNAVAEAARALGVRREPRSFGVPMIRALPGAASVTPESWRNVTRLLWV